MNDPTICEAKLHEIAALCRNRLDMSYYKYGAARDNFGAGRVDAAGCIDLCMDKFRKTRNTEYLLDVINYAALRILYPWPGDYFRPTGSDESAGTDGTPINMER